MESPRAVLSPSGSEAASVSCCLSGAAASPAFMAGLTRLPFASPSCSRQHYCSGLAMHCPHDMQRCQTGQRGSADNVTQDRKQIKAPAAQLQSWSLQACRYAANAGQHPRMAGLPPLHLRSGADQAGTPALRISIHYVLIDIHSAKQHGCCIASGAARAAHWQQQHMMKAKNIDHPMLPRNIFTGKRQQARVGSMGPTCGNAGGFPKGGALLVPGVSELGQCWSCCAKSGSAAAMFSAVTRSMLDCVLAARGPSAALSAVLPI